MKSLISIYAVSAICMMSFVVAEQTNFYEFFKSAYAQSFQGLETMKDAKGNWPHRNAVKDFDACELTFNTERGVDEMVLTRTYTDQIKSIQAMTDLENTFETMLPEWQYKRVINRNADGTRAISYMYNSTKTSERAKYPSVELDVIKRDNSWEVVVRLFEPVSTRK